MRLLRKFIDQLTRRKKATRVLVHHVADLGLHLSSNTTSLHPRRRDRGQGVSKIGKELHKVIDLLSRREGPRKAVEIKWKRLRNLGQMHR